LFSALATCFFNEMLCCQWHCSMPCDPLLFTSFTYVHTSTAHLHILELFTHCLPTIICVTLMFIVYNKTYVLYTFIFNPPLYCFCKYFLSPCLSWMLCFCVYFVPDSFPFFGSMVFCIWVIFLGGSILLGTFGLYLFLLLSVPLYCCNL